MFRVIASGDHHWHAASPRWNECQRIHSWVADLVERERPDLFVSAGDLYEKGSTPEEREAVAGWVTRIANVCPLIIARGNHDRQLDVALLRRLETRFPIIVEERAGVHMVVRVPRVGHGRGDTGGTLRIVSPEEASRCDLETIAAVAVVAWPSRATLAAILGRDVSQEERELVERDCLRDVLRGLGTQLDAHSDVPRLLVGHFMVDGSMTSTGQPLIGHTLNVSLADLALSRADLTLMAHIHMPQLWSFNHDDGRTMPILYTGSPFRTSYGECEEKSVTRATFEGARLVNVERVATPCQPMVLIETEWNEEAGHLDCHDVPWEVESADVRFRFSVTSDQREPANAAAEDMRRILLEGGAERVTLDPVVRPVTRARAPEITEARTLPDKMRLLWRVRGEQLGAAREERVIGKLATLDEENAA